MTKKLKKILALLLALSMTMSVVTVAALAEEEGPAAEVDQTPVIECAKGENCAAEEYDPECSKYQASQVLAPEESLQAVLAAGDVSALQTEAEEDGEEQPEESSNGWTLSADGTLTITTMESYDEVTKQSGWSKYKDQIKHVVIKGTVSTVPKNCFWQCTNIESVVFEEGVTKLDAGAFWGCTGLKSVDLSNIAELGEGVFIECSALERVVLPTGMKELPSNIFSRCEALKEIDLSGIENIGSSAFFMCTALTDVDLGMVKTIGSSAFSRSGLTSVIIPANTKLSGRSFFSNCTALEFVVFSDGVQAEGSLVLSDCPVKTLVIGENVSLGGNALASLQNCVVYVSDQSVLGNGYSRSENYTLVLAGPLPDELRWGEGSLLELGTRIEDGRAYMGEWRQDLSETALKDVSELKKNVTYYANWLCAGEHEWGELVIDLAPTCTEEGESYGRECKYCPSWGFLPEDNAIYDEEWGYYLPIPALGHEPDPKRTEDEVIIPATCTMDGSHTFYCVRCTNRRDPKPLTVTIPATEHVWDKWVDNGDGTHSQMCTHDESHVNAEKDPHVFGEWIVDVPAQVGVAGNQYRECEVCGHHENDSIPALPEPYVPAVTYYTLTVNYVDAEGNEVAPAVTRRLEEGSRYTVESPVVEGMTPDQETVTGILNSRTRITVVYTAVEDVEGTEPPLVEAPEVIENPEPTEPQPPETEEPEEVEEPEDLNENDTPLTETPEETEELGETETPLAEVPQTGDMLWLWVALTVSSAAGLIWLSLEEKKGRRGA